MRQKYSRDFSLAGRSSTSEHGVRGFDSQHDRLSLCDKGSKFLHLSIVRGERRAPEITFTMSARFNELGTVSLVGSKVLPA